MLRGCGPMPVFRQTQNKSSHPMGHQLSLSLAGYRCRINRQGKRAHRSFSFRFIICCRWQDLFRYADQYGGWLESMAIRSAIAHEMEKRATSATGIAATAMMIAETGRSVIVSNVFMRLSGIQRGITRRSRRPRRAWLFQSVFCGAVASPFSFSESKLFSALFALSNAAWMIFAAFATGAG